MGGRIREAQILLDMGFYQARAARTLASSYRLAIDLPLEDVPPDVAARQVTAVLQESPGQLEQIREDLRRVRELRQRLGPAGRGGRYGVLVDRYLPALQTVAYLTRTSPEAIGHTYALSRELTALQESALDPLDVIANSQEVSEVLGNIAQQAYAMEQSYERVRRAAKVDLAEDQKELAAVTDVLDTLVPGITLLRHVTAGTRSLVTIADAIESSGFLSQGFGSIAGEALEKAQQELILAREQVASLQKLLSVKGIDPEEFLPSLVFPGDRDVPLSATERVEVMLDEAISASRFLWEFLGFDGPKTYLLLGQNQKEIRASGGFIGVAVRVTVHGGELGDLVFEDSTLIDRPPLTNNPTPPEGLFWYLWMGNLLFRDSNWNPHFPASAAKVAEIYHLGRGVGWMALLLVQRPSWLT